MAEGTPMMLQYHKIKADHPDCILFFRLGDFYEMFNEDAKTASKELELTLTSRDRGRPEEERTPMCGVPYHAAEAYISRLIAKGYKVAICEQVEDPAQAKGLVERDIIRIVTPGTVIEETMLEEGRNNFLCALCLVGSRAGLCFADLSTGEVSATGFDGPGWREHVENELGRFSPREAILSQEAMEDKLLACLVGGVLLGVSLGVIFLQGATTGGTDLIARLLKLKVAWLPMGKLLMAIDLVVIVAVGVVDDSHPLGAGIKFILQIVAALIAVWHGVVIQAIANPLPFGGPYWNFGVMAVPITVVWIVAVTNSVNLIDGLDGLADGVSTIAALTMLIIALLMGDLEMAVICAALVGGCIGFIPYNRNPAKIFMGDTGSTFLGFVLATVSVTGLFKLYAIISFVVPFIILGFPIYDTVSAFTRRILKGQNPMKADRSHTHHKLIDMGMNQKQAVATLYLVATVLGLCAVMIVSTGYMKVVLSVAALAGTAYTVARIARYPHDHPKQEPPADGEPAAAKEEE